MFQDVDAITGPDDAIVYPEGLTEELDYELEKAVVIGKSGWFGPDEADDCIAGTIVNDITVRDIQRQMESGVFSLSPRRSTPSAASAPGSSPPTRSPTRMRFAFSRQPGDVVEHERRAVLDHGHLVLEGPAGPDPAPHRHPGLVPDMTEGELTGLLEDGAWLGSIWTGEWSTGGGGTYPVMEPATGQTLGEVGRATPGDVHDAAGRAVVAQRDCAARPFAERAAVLRRAGDLLTEHGEEMKQWLARESGAILPFGDFQVHTSAQECYEASALPSHP